MSLVVKSICHLIKKQKIVCRNTKLAYPLLFNAQFEKGTWYFEKSHFHCSPLIYKKEFIPMKPKLKPKDNYIADLSPYMTVKELSHALRRSTSTLFEIFTHVRGGEAITSSTNVITDVCFSEKVAKLLKIKYRLIKGPSLNLSELMSDSNIAERRPPPSSADLVPRQPVVTIMGHVDHGKTTLLDYLRKSTIVDQEYGGITQHIGAFEVRFSDDKMVTFIDTPGHATFKELRARGVMLTDIIVLVVAADDGVMPQTVEVIELAHASNVPIIVAINKIDKINADLEETRKSLLNAGIQTEDLGGDIQGVCISAKEGRHIDNLIEAIVVQAEIMELAADPKGMVEAFVLEAKRSTQSNKMAGIMATVIVQRGTMRIGQILVAGTTLCKVKAMFNDLGQPLKQARPGTAVQIYGFKEMPNAGDEILQVKNEKIAKALIKCREKELAENKMKVDHQAINIKRKKHSDVYTAQREENLKTGELTLKGLSVITYEREIYENSLALILKCDAHGSLEAISNVLSTYHSNVTPLSVAHSGIGPITDEDIFIAESVRGVIYTFNVVTHPKMQKLLDTKKIQLREHNIIYRLVETLQEDISNKMPLVNYEDIKGEALVMDEFLINDKNTKRPVAGCVCSKGLLSKKYSFKVVRAGEVLIDNCEMDSMRNEKTEVIKISEGKECGLMLKNKAFRFKVDDKIYCYEVLQKGQKTAWKPPGF